MTLGSELCRANFTNNSHLQSFSLLCTYISLQYVYIYIYQYVMCKLVSSINPSDASSGSILPPCWSPAIRTRWLWRPSVWIYKVPRCTERFSVEKHLLRMQLQWTWGVGDPTLQVSHVVSTPSQFDAGVLVFPASRNPPLSLAPFLAQQSHASVNSSNSIMLQA